MDAQSRKTLERILVAALFVAVATGSFVSPVGAQETEDAEPAVREGQWIDFAFGTGVEDGTRKVVGEGTSFPPETERVYCFTRVHGMHPPTTVTHVWYHESRTISRVELSIGSENWRTWSFKSRFPEWSGSWEVKVLNEDGMVLGSATFEIK